jgi:hypothetical protein
MLLIFQAAKKLINLDAISAIGLLIFMSGNQKVAYFVRKISNKAVVVGNKMAARLQIFPSRRQKVCKSWLPDGNKVADNCMAPDGNKLEILAARRHKYLRY